MIRAGTPSSRCSCRSEWPDRTRSRLKGLPVRVWARIWVRVETVGWSVQVCRTSRGPRRVGGFDHTACDDWAQTALSSAVYGGDNEATVEIIPLGAFVEPAVAVVVVDMGGGFGEICR
ncbi:hypothetical protein ACFXTO_013663 [Malus domestica]